MGLFIFLLSFITGGTMEIGMEKVPTAKNKLIKSRALSSSHTWITDFCIYEDGIIVLSNIILYIVSEYILEEKSFILLICHLCV